MLKNPIVHRILVSLGGIALVALNGPQLTVRELLGLFGAALFGVGSFNITGVKGQP